MKRVLILSFFLSLSLFLIGCGGLSTNNDTQTIKNNDLSNEPSNNDESENSNINVVSHNQGIPCLSCHMAPASNAEGEDFLSGGTVYTTLTGNNSTKYASGYKIRVLLDNDEKIDFEIENDEDEDDGEEEEGGGTANSSSDDSALSSNYTFTAQVINSSNSVTNSSSTNTHSTQTHLDCNSCHTVYGLNGAPGRITSSTQTTSTPFESPSLTFVNDVYPILNSSCATMGCHGDSTTSFRITTDINETYSNVESYTTTNDGLNSLLLKKASGSISHGGGIMMAAITSQYITIKEWIDNGALLGDVNATTVTPTPTNLSFANDVLAFLNSSCKSCHGNNGRFSITNAISTYTNINSFNGIDTITPESSELLRRSIGNNHQQIWSTSDSGYITVKAWITEGALNN